MRIEIADLGDWGGSELFSEYDPQGPAIRVNSRILNALPESRREEFIKHAIAHELYHHMECTGNIPRIRDREERERAAEAFASSLRLAALAQGSFDTSG